MKNQKGFIHIPLLIIVIASVVIASAGAGVVLHKQGKLTSLTADISEMFNKEVEENVEGNTTEKLSTEQTQEENQLEQNQEKLEKTQGEIRGAEKEEENQLESQFEIQPEEKIEEEKPEEFIEEEITPELEPEVDPCADVNCSDCQYCDSGICVNYCQGTNNNCGCSNCTNCNISDGCSGNNYLDYYCSGTNCTYTTDDCSDCSCSCDEYNIEESIERGNCEDGKDNDCDGYTDLGDSKCLSQKEFTVLTGPLGGNITQNSKLTLANSPYIVTETVQVLKGITLEIEPGVTIKFEENTGINIGGMLKAIGTKSKKIIFTSNNGNPSTRDWNEINFTNRGSLTRSE